MALSGMTGFGRAEGAYGGWSWAVEARSVNGRNLEVRFKGPPGFDSLERVARDGATARFQRGQVNVSLQARRAEQGGQVSVNIAQLERYLDLGAPYVKDGRAKAPRIDGLLALRGVIEVAEADENPELKAELEKEMAVSIAQALDSLKLARQAEGLSLEPILAGLVDRVESLVAAAEGEAAAQPAILRDRFAKRMAELLDGGAPEERIVLEAAVLAGKADVREELDRLTSHVGQARLLSAEAPAGRRLDFLTQEFMREANTLCSKSATTALTAIGLDLKAVIEQFREQVQNVE
ncbi:uncharacterized protein (TIGR00255 family) [Caulobacter ginsengisoli]|uniref:Uncharacterized protein (TIGR00255 family) n=1 Tax=Caulobacter ginsengisoli TaxID=400775 RepID=A0ABU0IPX0_9CAUL|nr:YicC/YloC family endoribonuclease [Caulobacter ginsengisoli]MDQ0464058.1 uncharacterized protein (TIGR00255 family) [Caulobacter ginsengisoli]